MLENFAPNYLNHFAHIMNEKDNVYKDSEHRYFLDNVVYKKDYFPVDLLINPESSLAPHLYKLLQANDSMPVMEDCDRLKDTTKLEIDSLFTIYTISSSKFRLILDVSGLVGTHKHIFKLPSANSLCLDIELVDLNIKISQLDSSDSIITIKSKHYRNLVGVKNKTGIEYMYSDLDEFFLSALSAYHNAMYNLVPRSKASLGTKKEYLFTHNGTLNVK